MKSHTKKNVQVLKYYLGSQIPKLNLYEKK